MDVSGEFSQERRTEPGSSFEFVNGAVPHLSLTPPEDRQFHLLAGPPLEPSATNVQWLREQLLERSANLELHTEYLVHGRYGFPVPFPHELLRLLPPDDICLEPRYNPRTNTIVAGLMSSLDDSVVFAPPSKVDYFHSNPVIQLNQIPLPDICPDCTPLRHDFIVRPHLRLRDWKSGHRGRSDLVLVDPDHPDRGAIERRVNRTNAAPVLRLDEVSLNTFTRFFEAKSAMEYCLRAVGGSNEMTAIPEQMHLLFRRLLECALQKPLLARSVMIRFDQMVLPAMRACGYPIAWTFGRSDEALVLPLLSYHPDPRVLHRLTKSLALSPLAALTYYAADALHLRYFASYDGEDVIKVPLLLNTIYPEVSRLIRQCDVKSTRGEPIAAERHQLRSYIRGLQNGLVTLADFGAFDELFGPLEVHSPRAGASLDSVAVKLHGAGNTAFRGEMREIGKSFLSLMKAAAKYCPEEFSPTIPAFYEYFHGYYGSDEVQSINRFNLGLPPDERVTLFEVVTGSDRQAVQQYYLAHRGTKPHGREERKRSQFSPEARQHVIYGRRVWRLFNALVMDVEPVTDHLGAIRPSKGLSKASAVFFRAADVLPDQRGMYLRVREFISRLPPPRDSEEALVEYLREGEQLYRDVERYHDALQLVKNTPGPEEHIMVQAARAFHRHLQGIAQLSNLTLSIVPPEKSSPRR